jgi:hypothetical protein
MTGLFLLCGEKAGDSAVMLGMGDQFGEARLFCFLFFCGRDPVGRQLFIAGGLRLEEVPGGFVGAELFFLFAGEAGALALLVGVDGGFFFAAGGEGLEAGRMHQALLGKLLNEVDVDGAPGAGGFARGEADGVARFVEALSNAVDPAEA